MNSRWRTCSLHQYNSGTTPAQLRHDDPGEVDERRDQLGRAWIASSIARDQDRLAETANATLAATDALSKQRYPISVDKEFQLKRAIRLPERVEKCQ